jgi:hypothetical protein
VKEQLVGVRKLSALCRQMGLTGRKGNASDEEGGHGRPRGERRAALYSPDEGHLLLEVVGPYLPHPEVTVRGVQPYYLA